MIAFFKKKPSLAELIPEGYIDIHSHILPGIDDGAKDASETQKLVADMKALGFAKCIATPHTLPHVWDNTTASITKALDLAKKELPIELGEMIYKAGSEYMMEGSFIERIKTEKLLTLKDNKVLVEMSYLNPPMDLKNILFELQINGYEPILAHPERYAFYHGNIKEYEKLIELGCEFQVNLLSTVGYYGKTVAAIADHLLKYDMIEYTGSDIHHSRHIQAFHNKITIKSEAKLVEAMQRNKIFIP